MGVAPDPNAGVQTSVLPGPHGGNLDNKRLGPGSTVYFRVNVPGAGFSAGADAKSWGGTVTQRGQQHVR